MARKHWFRSWSSRKPRRSSRLRRPGIEVLEGRILPATVNWINPGSGNWDTAANWSTGTVPGAGDVVVINTASAVTVTIQTGDTASVHSLTTAAIDTLSITGGSLSVAANSTLSGSLSMTGGELAASGSGVTFAATGTTNVSSASLYAGNGATLSLPNLTSYASKGTFFQADGTGSLLDVSALTTLTQQGSWQVYATGGGTVKLTGLSGTLTSTKGIAFTDSGTLLDNNLTTLDGVSVYLAGSDPQVASSWTTFSGGLLNVASSYNLPNLFDVDGSSLYAENGATLSLPNLTSYASNGSSFQAAGTGSVLDVSALTTLTQQGSWQVYATGGGTLKLTGLTGLTSTKGISFTDSGTLFDSNLTSLVGVTVYLAGSDPQVPSSWTAFIGGFLNVASSYSLPNLTDVDGSSLYAENGATLSLPNLTSYTSNGGSFQADGAGSVLDVSALTTLTQQGSWQVYATGGGTLKLTGLTSLTSTKGISFTDSGTLLDSNLTSLVDVTAYLAGSDPQVASSWKSFTGGSLTVVGSYNLPSLTDVAGSSLYVENGATLSLPELTDLGNPGLFLIGGATLNVPVLEKGSLALGNGSSATIQGTLVNLPATGTAGATINVPPSQGLTLSLEYSGTLSDATVNVGQGTTIDLVGGAYTGGTTFTIGRGGSAVLSGGTFTGGVTYSVAQGATVDLTGGQTTTYAGTLSGSGAGTVLLSGGSLFPGVGGVTLDFPGSLFQWTGGSMELSVGDVTNLGTINLSGSSQTQIYADGTLDNYGTMIQTGSGDFGLHSDNITPTTLKIEPGGQYLLESDAGINNLFNTNRIINAGTIRKTAGTGTSTVGVNGLLDNTGTIEADSGTLILAAASIAQLSGTTLTGGSWIAGAGGSVSSGGSQSSPNLVVNGDFEQGNTGFTSQYQFASPPTQVVAGDYTIGTNPSQVNGYSDWGDFGNHTSGHGNMLIANGGTGNVWSATVAVQPNTEYTFSFWAATINNSSQSVSVLQPLINSSSVGAGFTLPQQGGLWSTWAVTWNSGSATTATLSIVDSNTNGYWNDFALDDISFRKGSATPATLLLNNTDITTNAATVGLNGSLSSFPSLKNLAVNSGNINLAAGATLIAGANFTNSGSLTVGAGDTLNVNGAFTQTAGGALNVQLGGTPSSGQFGQIAVSGAATLAGAFDLALVNTFSPTAGQQFGVMTYASATGSFTSFSGLSPFFTESEGPTALDLNATTSAVDLAATSVTANTAVTAGQPITVNWQVTDESSQEATGTWQDSVYLSTTQAITSGSILLGSVSHSGGLDAGGSYNASWTGALPAVTPGYYYVLVQVDSLYQVPDPNRPNNTLAATTGQLNVSVPALALGTPSGGSFTAANQDHYYQVSVPAGGSLVVSLTSAASSGEVALYVSQGTLPTPYSYQESAAVANQPSPTVTVPPILTPETYYILVHCVAGDAASAGYTLTVSQGSALTVSAISSYVGGTGGNVTIEIDGTNFSSTATATLTLGTATLHATAIDFVRASQMYATFNLAGAAAGNYTLSVQQGAQSATAPTSFKVAGVGVESLNVVLVTPQFIRAGRTGSIVVTYSNASNNDLVAPLLTISSTNKNVYFSTPDDPNNYVQLAQVLAVAPNGPAGILRPGQSAQITLTLLSNDTIDGDSIPVQVNEIDAGQTIDWASQEAALKPSSFSTAAWNVIWSNLMSSVGTTTDSYNAALAQAATYLGNLGETSAEVSDVNRLWSFLVSQANASFPTATLSSAVDAALSTPGNLSLAIDRSFVSSIAGRYGLGIFGLGWVTSWQASLTADGSGNVTINADGGAGYFVFQPNGSYLDTAGEYGTLTNSGGAYTFTGTAGTQFVFLPGRQLNYVQDTNGNRITLGYNSQNELVSLTYSNPTDASEPVEQLTLTYTQGLVTQVADSAGDTWTYQYDTARNLLSVTGPGNLTTSYSYDTGSNPETANALLSVTNPDGSQQNFSYDPQSGRLTGTSQTGGADPITFAYPGQAEVTATDAAGNQSAIWYNDLTLASRVEDARGGVGNYLYDANGNLVTYTDAAGNIYQYGYDGKGDLTQIVNPLGQTVQMTYGSLSNLTSITDATGNKTQYSYSSTGNLLSITYPGGSEQSFSYDPLGNLNETVEQNGHSISYQYNAQGLLTQQSFSDGSSQSFTYDAHGNLLTAQTFDASGTLTGTTTLTYNAANELTSITYPKGQFLKFTYNPATGQRAQSIDQDGFTVDYSYDALGRLSELTDGSGNLIVQYTYNNLGQLKKKLNGNGTYTTYGYDPAGNLTSEVNYATGTTVNSSFTYTYNLLREMTSVTDAAGNVTQYGYDATGQLTQVTLPGGQSITYVYNAAGDRTEVISNGTTTTYASNADNEITQVGSAIYAYDANGNLHTVTDASGTTTYNFNDLNQLVSITGSDGTTTTFQYNPLGFLMGTSVNGTQTNYLVDPTGLGNVVGSYNGSGSLIAHYVYGLGLVSQTGPSGTGYYDFDASANTVGITGSSGAYVNRYSYLPFGETKVVSVALPNPFTFAGQVGVMQIGANLFSMRARMFAPVTGQFLSNDPIRLAGGDANLRRYVGNQPTTLVDPSGHQGEPIIWNGDPGYGPVQPGGGDEVVPVEPMPGPPLPSPEPPGPICYPLGDGGYTNINNGNTTHIGDNTSIGNGSNFSIFGNGSSFSIFGNGSNFSIFNIGNVNIGQVNVGSGNVTGSRNGSGNVIGSHNGSGSSGGGSGSGGAGGGSANTGPGQTVGGSDSKGAAGHDPNALIGPTGYGVQNFIQPAGTLPYTIDFENDGNAAAQDVTVTQQLDPNLDWNTFQLGSFGFGPVNVPVPAGLTQYQTTIAYQNTDGSALNVQVALDFNVQTGLLTVTFTSLDPATGEAPSGVFDGFLPPDDSSHVGEGYVQYTVSAKPQAATGTVVNAQASVVFDTNAALATNTVSNTIADVVDQTTLSEPAGTITPAAEKISTLLTSHYSDPDGSKNTRPGVAVIGTTGNGAWQYSTNGKTWTNIAAVSTTSALLLPQANQVRFLPAGLSAGSAELLYVAWDGSAGTSGQYGNAGTVGGATPFSTEAGELNVILTAVTQAPVWLASTTTLTPVLPGDVNPAGQTVAQAFGSEFSGDQNQSSGVAVMGLTGITSGTWQYQFASGGGWQNFPRVSASAALLLGPNDLIRFVPKSGFTGLATLAVHAWDGGGNFTDGGSTNVSKAGSTGGTTPFSSAVLTGKIDVNHAPTQNAIAVSLPSSPENTASKTVSVATLLKDAKAADVDRGATLGLALTGASGPGAWQYELPGNVWQNVPSTLSAASVLLLPSTAMLRFDPKVSQSGTATVSWDVWDGTQGTAGQGFTIAGTPSSASAFSSTSATATLTVLPSQHPPAWSGSGAALTPVVPGTTNPRGDKVSSVFGSFYEDPSATVGIAVTAISGAKNGQWQYSTDSGSTWQSLAGILAGQARLLSVDDLIRFVPKAGFLGTVTLTAYAWDGTGTGNSHGNLVRAHGSRFSSTTLTATCLVNTAPTLSD